MNSKKLGIALATLTMIASGCSTTSSSTAGEAAMGECHGINSCKGTGDCGGKGHGCAGLNSCKGHGWKKMSQEECEEKGGKFKA